MPLAITMVCAFHLYMKSRSIGGSVEDTVRSAERMFDLLEIIAGERSPIGLTELAERANLSKTTTHRLMKTMCSRHPAALPPSNWQRAAA